MGTWMERVTSGVNWSDKLTMNKLLSVSTARSGVLFVQECGYPLHFGY